MTAHNLAVLALVAIGTAGIVHIANHHEGIDQ